jgi:hypothetical protein
MEESIDVSGKSKWTLVGLVIVGVVLAGAYMLFAKPSTQLLGQDVKLVVYIKDGKTLGGMASVKFLEKAQGDYYLSLGVDTDKSDKFSQSEWVVKNLLVTASAAWYQNLPFKSEARFESSQKIRVVASSVKISEKEFEEFVEGNDSIAKDVGVEQILLEEIFGSEKPSNPEESMKQGDTAQVSSQTVPASGVPDFSQRKAECAPTVAANGLYSLAVKNGAADKLPKNPSEMIDGLKGDMLWTPAEGVVPDNFVNGKNKWAVTHGLPIKTEKIGDKDGRGTLDEIKTALAGGSAVEMRIRFADADLKVIGGHIVSVVAVREVDGQTFIDVHDPASPRGTETYPVSANEILNYPYHDGDTVVGWGFKQTWEGAPMGGSLDVMTDQEMQGVREFAGETKTIKAIQYNGKYIPLSEVHVGKGDHCDSKEDSYAHYHSNNGSFSLATDGSKVPDNTGCGYGKVKDTRVIDIQVP